MPCPLNRNSKDAGTKSPAKVKDGESDVCSKMKSYKNLKTKLEHQTPLCRIGGQEEKHNEKSDTQIAREPVRVDLMDNFNYEKPKSTFVQRGSFSSKTTTLSSSTSSKRVSDSKRFSDPKQISTNLKLASTQLNMHGRQKSETSSTSTGTMRDKFAKPVVNPSCSKPEIVSSSSATPGNVQKKFSNYENWLKTVTISYPRDVSDVSSTSTSVKISKSSSSDDWHTKSITRSTKGRMGTQFDSGKQKEQDPCDISIRGKHKPPKIGVCYPTKEQIARMSSARQKFFLTQDPRKTMCLVNPEVLHQKKTGIFEKEQRQAAQTAKLADNLCVDSASNASSDSFIGKEIDLLNPFDFDFQGLDYRDTYEKDEQNYLNVLQYQRICRHLQRDRTRKQIGVDVEAELQKERLTLPSRFDTTNRTEPPPIVVPKKPIKDCELYRSTDKPYNIELLRKQQEDLHDRYKDLYLRKRARDKSQAEKQAEEEKQNELLKKTELAAKFFQEALDEVDEALANRGKKPTRKVADIKKKERVYPHKMSEVEKYKYKMEGEKLIEHDQAVVRKEFFRQQVGKEKDYPELHIEFGPSARKAAEEILGKEKKQKREKSVSESEESTEDENQVKVIKSSKDDRRVKLCGFLSDRKVDENKANEAKHRTRGCMTRDDWLKEVLPFRDPVKPDLDEGFEKSQNPNDPNLVLYTRKRGRLRFSDRDSAVKNFIKQRLGLQYERVKRKTLRLYRPRLQYNIKRFNLIGYLYRDMDRKLQALQLGSYEHEQRKKETVPTTEQYLLDIEKAKKLERLELKNKRLALMGIPCKQQKKKKISRPCEEDSETSTESEYVPSEEPEIVGDLAGTLHRSNEPAAKHLPANMIGNMPAPDARETTLRRHPRKPRAYCELRAPSTVFDEIVKTSGVPYMHKLLPEIMRYANIRDMEKSVYTDMLDARHHHDHWEPTQKQTIDIHYQPRLVNAEDENDLGTEDKGRRVTRKSEAFMKAQPPCKAYIDVDLTLPKWNIDEIIAEHKLKKTRTRRDPNEELVIDICKPTDVAVHSRPSEELENLDFPGRERYLNFLQEIRKAILDSQAKQFGSQLDDDKEHLVIDKEAYRKELEDDLKSIESCLTSMSSSDCTNLSNDSGSFFVMEEGTTKVPLDYIRKSRIPFEDNIHKNMIAEPYDHDAEEINPFRTLPHCDHTKVMKEIYTPKDKFYTYPTRNTVNLRMRLEVPPVDVKGRPFGRGHQKFPAEVATDLDENYIVELNKRPPVLHFNFKSSQGLLKEALRFKFQTLIIEEEIVRNRIYKRLNEEHWKIMLKTEELYDRLFTKWERRLYKDSLSIVYQVKYYYEATALLRQESREIERQITLLNMDIVFIESTWIRLLLLQNFHYLLADNEWRYKHDWIHSQLDEDGNNELEPLDVSIANRPYANIRERGKDDAYAVKSYYEEVYLANKHPVLFPYKDVKAFLLGIEKLKSKTFVSLLELHYTMSIHTGIKGYMEIFEEKCLKELEDKKRFVDLRCSKKYFMEHRLKDLALSTTEFIGKPIENSYNDANFNHDRAIITEVYHRIMLDGDDAGDGPNVGKDEGDSELRLEPHEMVAAMFDYVMEIFTEFESMDMQKMRRVEQEFRRKRALQRKISRNAYQVEGRIEQQRKIIDRNMEPPYVKPKREGKLKRMRLIKKVEEEPVEEVHISEHTKNFFRAFHEDGASMDLSEIRESLLDATRMEDTEIPFYFDHFLKLQGYKPDYNFKTKLEKRDGPEINRFQVQSVLPEVVEKMKKWESLRKKVMEDHIARSAHLYENVG